MKRIIALLLTIFTLTALFPVGAAFAAEDDTPALAAPVSNAEAEATAEESDLPAAYTLVGTSELPPITNQGGVGSCASEAIAYMQFTNAVAHYMHAASPATPWDPSSGNKAQIFSAHYTYSLSGPSNSAVYSVLKSQGCIPISLGDFYRDGSGAAQYQQSSTLMKKSVKWDVEKDNMLVGLSYRLKSRNYNADSIGNSSTSAVSDALRTKIKDALIRGNVVSTSGIPSRWLTGYLSADGEIGKKDDPVIIAAAGTSTGNHTISIVGYDDSIQCKVGNSTMVGGFLIANSWGKTYGKDGYIWVMYDALNAKSAFDEYNEKGFYSGEMYLDAINDKTVVMNPNYAATGEQDVTFTKAEKTVKINGTEYPTYNIKSDAMGGYLAYSTNSSNHDLHIEQEPGANTRWAFIPYEVISKWSSSNAANVDEKYMGSYWVYAAGRSSAGATGYAYLDAGLSVSSSGRTVGIASHNALQYPEAKSWYVELTDKENLDTFTSPVGIFAGRGTSLDRKNPLYEFNFTYWDEDITLEKPELYIKMDVTTDNREAIDLSLSRQRKEAEGTSGRSLETPYFTTSSGWHSSQEWNKADYWKKTVWNQTGYKASFSGEMMEKAKVETVTMYIPYTTLLAGLEEGKTLADYRWGIRLGARQKSTVTYSNVQLLSQSGTVLGELTFGENKEKSVTLDASASSSMSTVVYAGGNSTTYEYFDLLPDKTYTATVKGITGITVTPVTTSEGYRYGETYSFKLETGAGYDDTLLTVTKNGAPLLGKDGVYTTTICGDTEITVTGVRLTADLNGDEAATIQDVTVLLAYLTQDGPLAENATPDLNGDGSISTKDITRLLMFLGDGTTVLHPGRLS